MQEYLHSTKNFFNKKAFKKIIFIQQRWSLLCLKMASILLIFLLIRSFHLNHVWLLRVSLFIGLFMLLLVFILYNHYRKSLKSFVSNKSANTVINFNFFNNYFILNFDETTKLDAIQTDYTDLYKIVEVKSYFYLMLSKNKGTIISKKDCTPELISFLQQLKKINKE